MRKHTSDLLHALGIKTIHELGNSKYFNFARALLDLESSEVAGKRHEKSLENFDRILDKEHASKSIHELLEEAPSAMRGIGAEKDAIFAGIHLKKLRSDSLLRMAPSVISLLTRLVASTETWRLGNRLRGPMQFQS